MYMYMCMYNTQMGTIFKVTFCAFVCIASVGCAATELTHKDLNSNIQHGKEQDAKTLSALMQRIERLESRDSERVKQAEDHQAEIGQLREEIGTQRRTIDNQQREIDTLNAKLNGPETACDKTETTNAGPSRRASTNYDVAFFARVSAQALAVGANGTVIFETIDSNESGAYDNVTGVFTAPVTGSYVFSISVSTFATYQTHVGLVRNGERLTQLWVDGQAQQYGSASQTTLLHLQNGDLVTVRQQPETETYVQGSGHTMFTGFLLFATF